MKLHVSITPHFVTADTHIHTIATCSQIKGWTVMSVWLNTRQYNISFINIMVFFCLNFAHIGSTHLEISTWGWARWTEKELWLPWAFHLIFLHPMTNQMQDYLGFSTESVTFPFRLQALCSSSLLGFDNRWFPRGHGGCHLEL